MKKVTFSVEEELIKKARDVARLQNKTLNAEQFTALMKRLRKHVRARPPYTRDEMNER